MADSIETTPDSINEPLDALSHPYRRRILTRLHDHDSRGEASLSMDSVANGEESDGPVAIDIHHRHLPKLADRGFIEWEQGANTVRPGPRFDEISSLIALMVDNRDELPAGWP